MTTHARGRWGQRRLPESGADFFRPDKPIQPERGGARPIPKFDMADRMRKSLREADVSVQEMAEYLEVSRNTVGNWINGKTRPNAPTLKLWSLRVGISYEWIRNGESPDPHEAGRGSEMLPRLDLNQRPSGYPFSQVACDVTPLPKRSGTGRSRRAELLARRRHDELGAAA